MGRNSILLTETPLLSEIKQKFPKKTHFPLTDAAQIKVKIYIFLVEKST